MASVEGQLVPSCSLASHTWQSIWQFSTDSTEVLTTFNHTTSGSFHALQHLGSLRQHLLLLPCLLVAFYEVLRQFARIASLFKFEIPGEFPQHSEGINARAKPIAFGSVNVFPSSAK